jgi:hypothetical protein
MNPSLKRNAGTGILIGVCFLTALLWLGHTGPAFAASPIDLDGDFADWSGQANIVDVSGDANKDERDVTKFWWADNADVSTFYWRIDRISSKKKVKYVLHIDANNNGDFNDNADREVEVAYKPRKSNSHVDVKVRYGDTRSTISHTKKNDWGESEHEGGRYVEFEASFADLGINPGQAMRFYVGSLKGKSEDDRTPDSGDIQWSVVNVLGYPLLAGFMIGASLLIWRKLGRRAWIKA